MVNQCLDLPLGMLHYSGPGRVRHIQFSTLYFLHLRHPCEEYSTPFLRRWAGCVQLSLLLTASESLHCIRLHYLTFPVSEQRFATLRRLPSLLVSKGEWFPFSRESCLVPSLVAFLQLFLELFVDNSLSSCRWICQPKNV